MAVPPFPELPTSPPAPFDVPDVPDVPSFRLVSSSDPSQAAKHAMPASPKLANKIVRLMNHLSRIEVLKQLWFPAAARTLRTLRFDVHATLHRVSC